MIRYIFTSAVETLCLISAFYFLRGETERHWRLHPWYLLLVVATDATGGYLAHVCHVSNTWLYNLFIPIEGIFIGYFLFRLCKRYGMQRTYWQLFAAVLIVCYTIERVFSVTTPHYCYWTTIFMSLVFILGTIRYAYLLLKAAPQSLPLQRHAPSIWVCAVSLFYFGTFVATLLAEPLITARVKIADTPLYSAVYFLLNLMLYGLWIVTFIYRYRSRH